MRQIIIIVIMLLLASSCNFRTKKLEVSPNVSVNIPLSCKVTINEQGKNQKMWETSIEDDQFAVFRYTTNLTDSLSFTMDREIFTTNINSFLKPFDFRDIDSTYMFSVNWLECDLSFDFKTSDEDYRLYGKMIADKNNFIAFIFQTPYPVDYYSRKIKEKIFRSIEVN